MVQNFFFLFLMVLLTNCTRKELDVQSSTSSYPTNNHNTIQEKPSTPCTFRTARLEDFSQLLQLKQQLGYFISLEEIRERLIAFQTNPLNRIFIAEEKGQIIGCVALAVNESFDFKGRTASIWGMVVDEKRRFQGIGKHLMDKAEDYAREIGCVYIELTSSQQRAPMGGYIFSTTSLATRTKDPIKKYTSEKNYAHTLNLSYLVHNLLGFLKDTQQRSILTQRVRKT